MWLIKFVKIAIFTYLSPQNWCTGGSKNSVAPELPWIKKLEHWNMHGGNVLNDDQDTEVLNLWLFFVVIIIIIIWMVLMVIMVGPR